VTQAGGFLVVSVIALWIAATSLAFAENIDPANDQSQYAYSENIGWLNAKPSGDGGPGVQVDDATLSGWMWGENVGWVSLSCVNTSSCSATNYGVTNDGCGTLTGLAWSENVGWINFAPTTGGVSIDPQTGDFSGAAWGENIGWITFADDSPVPYGVNTSWRSSAPTGGPAGVCAGSPTCIEPPPNLAAWWPGDGTSQDIVGTADGSLQGNAAFTAGKVGAGFALGGNGDSVFVGDVDEVESTTEFTLSLWANFASFGSGLSDNVVPLVTKWLTAPISPNQNSFALVETDGLLNAAFADEADQVDMVLFAHSMTLNVWHHIVVVFDAGRVEVFVNGSSIGSATLAVTAIGDSVEPLRIGDWYYTYNNNYRTFEGMLDEIQIWRRALHADEVVSIYEAGSGGTCTCTDHDGDGYGTGIIFDCLNGEQPDCDDANGSVYPGAPEVCDRVSNDCLHATWPTPLPEDTDDDLDNVSECEGDCNDADSAINPAATEVCNAVDDNCNALVDEDALGEDTDNDGIQNLCDNCLTESNADQYDADADGSGDTCDNCPSVTNPEQADFDSDQLGDICETGATLADADLSGRVDGFDLARMARAFGTALGEPQYDRTVDLSRDGQVDGDDLAALASFFGDQAEGGAATWTE
jgi:hypothetical protein